MSREELRDAAETLREGATHADGDRRRRIEGQADALETLADRERGPDQGRLDRHMNILRELGEEEDGATDYVDRALEYVRQYREGVGGI
ncbi:DUF7553 family protein [Halomarina litorea]|uniref:DUF7553 family protein n=1 Tax=Halomarina litorea TaxID=2961595 RepID=UPI0020C49B9A|nr:hypothetical protein [Halomarina sp. BCD28]